jgi:hypothetical protein
MIAQGRGQDLVLEDEVMIAGLRAAAAGITFAAGAIAPAAAISQEGRRVDPNASYVFFLHGRGVERGSSGRRYGHFQFDQIVASLQRSGRIVIAPRRGRRQHRRVRQPACGGRAPPSRCWRLAPPHCDRRF